ncbi:hypothetical protein [Sphingorhabdus lutea]|uniref:hypothetical protein n=1 Tax=Sphingorhabdus lutea TaxID=1913578 RepID=UPI0012EBB61A|nr:hypothetical protein [Sphingorhabdus lutea]
MLERICSFIFSPFCVKIATGFDLLDAVSFLGAVFFTTVFLAAAFTEEAFVPVAFLGAVFFADAAFFGAVFFAVAVFFVLVDFVSTFSVGVFLGDWAMSKSFIIFHYIYLFGP